MSNIQPTEQWPSYDGEFMIYQTTISGDKLVPPLDTNKYMIYVNGIATKAGDFKYQCQNLSSLFSCRIVGVFNKSNGYALDVMQCISDYDFIIDNTGICSFSTFTGAVLLSPLGLVLPKINNPATATVFYLLATYGALWPSKPICILAHSQGNLITSGGLCLFAKWLQEKSLPCPDIKVFAVASPAPQYPESQLAKLNVKYITDPDDPVTYLSVLRSFSGNVEFTGSADRKLTFDAHDLSSYESKWPFIHEVRRTLFPDWLFVDFGQSYPRN
jgi:hypothetical protein